MSFDGFGCSKKKKKKLCSLGKEKVSAKSRLKKSESHTDLPKARQTHHQQYQPRHPSNSASRTSWKSLVAGLVLLTTSLAIH
jgi:hypothetical protein